MKLFFRTLAIAVASCILISCGGGGGGENGYNNIELVDYGSATRYPFDESAGTTAYNEYFDDFHGQIVGAQRVEGKSGNALDFSAVDGSHVLFDICCNADRDTSAGAKWVTFPNDSFTIAAWIKPTNMISDTIYPIFGGWYGSVQSLKVRINNESIELLLYPENNGAPKSIITSASYLSNNAWTHFTITHDGFHTSIYLNGVEDNSADIVMPVKDFVNDYFIGGIPIEESAGPGVHSFPGIIDDFFISGNILSQEQIDALISESN